MEGAGATVAARTTGAATGIAVVGMHRSGTSMTMRVLNLLGVEVGGQEQLRGPSIENPDGYWEHADLMYVNVELLRRLGGDGRHVPDLPDDWPNDAAFNDLRRQASELLGQIGERGPWGWKDPRTTVTLPFWRQLVPDLRVVMCVRHPLEVFDSLRQRHPCLTRKEGLAWWTRFYEVFEENRGDTPVLVTDYAAWHHDAQAEAERVCKFVGLEADPDAVHAAAASVRVGLYRNRRSERDLRSRGVPENVRRLYARLLIAAGPVSRAAGEDDSARRGGQVRPFHRRLFRDTPRWLRPRCYRHVLARRITSARRSIRGRIVG